MKLVDILFVLTAAATANAILIPTDNDGSPQASSTSSQVSGPTDEPNPGTSDDWQSIMDELDLSILDKDQQQPIDESSSGTFNQVSGPTNEPNPQIPDEDWQEIMDIIHSKKPNQDQQQPIDELSSDIFNQVSVPTNEPIPQIPDDDWQEIMDIIHSNIPGNQQYSTDEVNSSTSNQDQQNPIDQPSQSTSNQDQQQPMNEADSASTSSSRMIILKEKYQRTFDRLRKRLELSKEIRNKKRQEYHNYAEIGLKQWSALSRGKEIPESKHSLKDEIRLKQEYVAARNRVRSVRNELKKYMKRHGLEFQEPKADSD
ncbi:hypothetical protein QVD99_008595 [Batrachochytrium dendrobatidis]|nr:hypothetical protein QVD99_008595 [Batrachochytrium dendrobatidis]